MEVEVEMVGAANGGPLMKLIFNSMCILMKQAGLGDDTRPPLRDANKAVLGV